MALTASPAITGISDFAAPALQTGRRGLLAIALLGALLACPPALFLAWTIGGEAEYASLGNFFLAMNIGLLTGLRLSQHVNEGRSLRAVFLSGCLLASTALAGLSLLGPPIPAAWRLVAFALLGVSISFLQTGIAYSIVRLYAHSAPAVLTFAATLLNLGAAAVTLVAAAFFSSSRQAALPLLLAIGPTLWLIPYSRRMVRPATPLPTSTSPVHLRYPAAVLLSLLLFVELANEWVLINWLPMFLNRQIGQNGTRALMLGALFSFVVAVSRLTAYNHIQRRGTKRLTIQSVASTFFGCVFLTTTNNVFGSVVGILLAGWGAGLILPIALCGAAARLPRFEPGIYSGLCTIGLTGAFLASWSLGHLAELNSLRILMLLPLFGNWLAACLLGLLALEGKLANAIR